MSNAIVKHIADAARALIKAQGETDVTIRLVMRSVDHIVAGIQWNKPLERQTCGDLATTILVKELCI